MKLIISSDNVPGLLAFAMLPNENAGVVVFSVALAPVEVTLVDVLLNPNVGTDVAGPFDPKTNGLELALVTDGCKTDGNVGATVFAVAVNENAGGLPVPSGFAGNLGMFELVGVPKEIGAFVVSAGGLVDGLVKLNIVEGELIVALDCVVTKLLSVLAVVFVLYVGGANEGKEPLLVG